MKIYGIITYRWDPCSQDSILDYVDVYVDKEERDKEVRLASERHQNFDKFESEVKEKGDEAS